MSKDLWGQLAGTYEVDHAYLAGTDLISAIQAKLAATVTAGNVVELGCGTGLYTRAYAPHCRQVIATDISGPMIERAKGALAAFPNVSVRVADAVATGLPAGSADSVVAVNLLHIVPDAEAVLAEARRLLRPGGELVIVDATGDGLSFRQILASIWRGLRRWGLKTHQKGQRNLTQATLEALVRTAGFTSVQGQAMAGTVMNAAFVRAVRPAG